MINRVFFVSTRFPVGIPAVKLHADMALKCR
jgi:hypothetical protein